MVPRKKKKQTSKLDQIEWHWITHIAFFSMNSSLCDHSSGERSVSSKTHTQQMVVISFRFFFFPLHVTHTSVWILDFISVLFFPMERHSHVSLNSRFHFGSFFFQWNVTQIKKKKNQLPWISVIGGLKKKLTICLFTPHTPLLSEKKRYPNCPNL